MWTLALLFATSAAGLAGTAAAPLAANAPTRLPAISAAFLAAGAAAVIACGNRLGDRTLIALASTRIVIVVLVMASAKTAGGTFFAAAGLVWVVVWTTAFYSARLQLTTLTVEAAAIALAAVVNSHHLRTAADGASVLSAAIIVSTLFQHALGGLRREARQDHLTGLLNRLGLDEALRELNHGQALQPPVSLVAIDLDGFKAINDEKGHVAGDRMLIAFATEIASAAGRGDLVARMGGDEFIAILPGTSAAQAERWADALTARTCLAWSFGVAERHVDEPLESWLSRADRRMYAAKGSKAQRPSVRPQRPQAHGSLSPA